MSGRSRATAPRSRRCRASSSRCRARRCGNGWPPTCRRSICWRSRSMHVGDELILVAAVGIDATGEKHPLGLVEGATENAATVQALLDNLVERGLDPAVMRLFIIDGAKALSKAIRRTFGRNTPIQRCQVHKARNIAERLPKEAQARGSPAGLGNGGGPSSGSAT